MEYNQIFAGAGHKTCKCEKTKIHLKIKNPSWPISCTLTGCWVSEKCKILYSPSTGQFCDTYFIQKTKNLDGF